MFRENERIPPSNCYGGLDIMKSPEHREVGITMLYVGFGSISGLVHLIARLPSVVKPVAISLIAVALVAPLR